MRDEHFAEVMAAKEQIGVVLDRISALREELEGMATKVAAATGGADSNSHAGRQAAESAFAAPERLDEVAGVVRECESQLDTYALGV